MLLFSRIGVVFSLGGTNIIIQMTMTATKCFSYGFTLLLGQIQMNSLSSTQLESVGIYTGTLVLSCAVPAPIDWARQGHCQCDRAGPTHLSQASALSSQLQILWKI